MRICDVIMSMIEKRDFISLPSLEYLLQIFLRPRNPKTETEENYDKMHLATARSIVYFTFPVCFMYLER